MAIKLLCVYLIIGAIWLVISWAMLYLMMAVLKKSGIKKKDFWSIIMYKLFLWPYDIYCGFKSLYDVKHEFKTEEERWLFVADIYDEITED